MCMYVRAHMYAHVHTRVRARMQGYEYMHIATKDSQVGSRAPDYVNLRATRRVNSARGRA